MLNAHLFLQTMTLSHLLQKPSIIHIDDVLHNLITEVGKNKFDINDEAVIVHFDGTLFNRGTLDKEKLSSLDEQSLPSIY